MEIFTEQRLAEEGEMPAAKPIRRVRGLLSDVKHVLESTLIIAESDKAKAQEQARDHVEAQKEKTREARQVTEDLRTLRDTLDEENTALKEKIGILEQQAESVQALKEVWEKQEAELAGKVEELTATAGQVPSLEERVKELERIEGELRTETKALQERRDHLVSTVEQKDTEISEASADIGRLEKEASACMDRVREAEKTARESAFDQEKADLLLKNRESEIRQELAEARVEEIQRYGNEIAGLNGQIQELTKGHAAQVGELNARIQELMAAKPAEEETPAPAEKPAEDGGPAKPASKPRKSTAPKKSTKTGKNDVPNDGS